MKKIVLAVMTAGVMTFAETATAADAKGKLKDGTKSYKEVKNYTKQNNSSRHLKYGNAEYNQNNSDSYGTDLYQSDGYQSSGY